MNITLTVGLSGSGKSTWAKQQAGSGTVIVCKDDIRAMLWPDGKWSGKREAVTSAVQNAAARAALDMQKFVIVADTNLNPRVQQHWREVAKEYGIALEIRSFLDVPLQTCIERDLQRRDSVGEAVIRKQYMQYVAAAKPAYDPALPDCIIVDVDGTLAWNPRLDNGRQRRGWYEWQNVSYDDVHSHVAEMVQGLHKNGTRVVVLTGRDGVCLPDTEAWLAANDIPFDEIYSRAAGDQRRDDIIKQELYEKHVKPKYNVRCVLDDRQQVVDLWHGKLGLEVLQVLHPQEPRDF